MFVFRIPSAVLSWLPALIFLVIVCSCDGSKGLEREQKRARNAEIQGVVLGPDGEPRSNWTVYACPYFEELLTTKTDASGRFVFPWPEEGTWGDTLVAVGPDSRGFAVKPTFLDLVEEPRPELTLFLSDQIPVRLQAVHKKDGKPMEGVTVVIETTDSDDR
ncbi:MAG: hypothetical protein DWQ01_11175 [Planctomycetota bacterium]|nr:MAG: hypothetical protein DWQ01_11175 [Planctomycetota bacterium]